MRAGRAFLITFWVAALMMAGLAVQANTFLNNGVVNAEFDSRGLVSLQDIALNTTWHFTNDNCSVTIGGVAIDTSSRTPTVTAGTNNVAFLFTSGNYQIKVVYELKAGWRFVSRQIQVTPTVSGTFHVNSVTAMTAKVTEAIASTYKPTNTTGSAFLRTGSAGAGDNGIMLVLQNDFLSWSYSNQVFTMSYTPDMDWNDTWGTFYGDRVCIGTYQMAGYKYPSSQVSEWTWQTTDPAANGLDWSEIEAFQNCVRAFLLFDTSKASRVDIGWCENDFQIDTATAAGRAEEKRIMDMCTQLGIDNLLYTPANSTVAPTSQNTDAWSWEDVLWWNMGQQVRKGTWSCATGVLPSSVQEMVDYANNKNLKLMAYVYPSLGFKQMAEWTAWCGGNTGGYVGVDTGVHSFQDWFVQQLTDFHNNLGCNGYSFDHWWIAYDSQTGQPPVSSRYAQWNGCRRILENMRKNMPEIVIDGRQQYQGFGVWTWLAGNYPHPTTTDEQPESFKPFPDLHTDRVSANRQRWSAWWYRMVHLAPTEVTPGYITHQTQRYTSTGGAPRTDFRTRDWDMLGWKFSLFSTIGTAPFNLVMNYIPAKDMEEYSALSSADKQFIKDWFNWVDTHIEYLRVMRPIISQPMIGRIDGTAAILNNNGFVFLFNPNYRKLDATFALNQSIGLKSGTTFTIRELEPRAGRLIAKAGTGVWSYGDTVSIPVDGTTAMVLQIEPAAAITSPVLYNVLGSAALNGTTLQLTGVSGEVGTSQDLYIAVPAGANVNSVTVNGQSATFTRTGDVVKATVLFAGVPFGKAQQIGSYSSTFTGGTVTGTFVVPKRIFDQLSARRDSWPVTYTEDDLLATWLGSDRLLLNIHIANPSSSMVITCKIDGINFPVQTAWNGIYPRYTGTFLGFYVDVSKLVRDVTHTIEVTVPSMSAGQFQGLFFDNVEPEYTQTITTTPTTPVTYTVSGRVTSSITGAEVAGAVVYFSDKANASVAPLITATADANGYYTRTLPSPSTWYVCAGAAAFNMSSDQYVSVNGANVSNINFSVVPNSTLYGKVVKRADGTAISGATVYFSTSPNAALNPTFTATTDASGSFSQLLQNGTWYVAASATGFFSSADRPITLNGTDVSGFTLSLASNTRNIPQTPNLLFSCVTDSFPASGNTGNWAYYLPSGSSLTAQGTPSVDMVNGIKWEKNIANDVDGYDKGSYSSSIAVNGASIVVAAIPYRVAGYGDPWTSIADIMYDRLVLGIHNGTGQVCVRRNGSNDRSNAVIPEGQITILSLVVQPDGTYKVWANGTQIMNITTTNAMTAFVPGVTGSYANHINVGRNNPDAWPTFNGNIGDVFVYKVALTDAERQQLEADLYNKFVSHFITASAGIGGTISPNGLAQVSHGANQTFAITPNAGYQVASVVVDGVNQGAINSYTFANVTANHTISATFVGGLTYTIAASAGANGSISPSGNVIVNQGYAQTFTIAPNTGYAVSQVTVDGVNQGAITSYTFNSVTANHTIAASFAAIPPRTITASAGTGGTISPTGAVSVNYGTNQTFSIAPNSGYVIAQVAVDGVNQGAISSYTFSNVTANHTISATFNVYTGPTPVAFYQFEQNVLDAQGAYNGTAYGTPTYVAGKIGGYAIQFDGSSQYVSIPRPVSGDFSIAFWVKTSQSSSTVSNWYNGKGLVDGEVGGTTNDFGVTYASKKIAFGVGNADTTFFSTSTINGGSWYHVACTRNATTGEMKIYVNGVLEKTGTGPTGNKTSPSTLHFGNLQTNINYFNGAMDQVKIYNIVLTAADVAILASEGNTFTITATAGANGSISPSGAVTANYGASQPFTITPAAGYAIADLKVDGTSILPVTSYTFSNVTADHTISVTFGKPMGVSNKSAVNDSKLTSKVVRVWGKVSGYTTGASTFTISDGYSTSITVKADAVSLPSGFANGKTVVITGIRNADKTIQAQSVTIP